MEKIYMAALSMVPGIGTAKLKKLVAYFGSAEQVWRANNQDLILSGQLDESLSGQIISLRRSIDILKLADKWQREGIKICSLTDDDYPGLLRQIFDPPLQFYYRGNLPLTDNLLAIVGSRQATAYGKNAASMLAAGLAAAGVWIVSGAARGIDSAAHTGALGKGNTIAVLGCGVDVVYPPENRKLLAQIAEQGAVISEYAPGTLPYPAYFPARNRIISGLSRGTVIVEAAAKSGALITADCALNEGRDVFAVPGSIFSSASKGVHNLIKQGARLVDSVDEILEEYQLTAKPDGQIPELAAGETAVLKAISYEQGIGVEDIVNKTQLTPAEVSYIILQLELRGLLAELEGRRYIRVAKGVIG